ncbi:MULTISPECIES: hypothetical protein [Lacticaseibacillus]|uniref:hypothetical protein n=1 Tax=Lacticaseibacillus TaxID=2759736 RepID=UPI00046AB52D|nr:hypothetical protein [Lacticaseibacillus casei]MBI6597574.1 hypothetical protein [Lacticaseibacillus casei]MBO1481314.1 hypothetical protein [Lacticaseibacillus casei]MBO2416594.1 hypothetical protein [Lacticaseibacillus casei]MCK2080953.1 hypothetical protein [Lacticaseibacillus casei]MDZ5495519.1 hypothetical protein [Lacticaseibacillus casei]
MKLTKNLRGKRVRIGFKDPEAIVTPAKWNHALVTYYTSELDDDKGENIEISLDNDPTSYVVYGDEIKSIEVVK